MVSTTHCSPIGLTEMSRSFPILAWPVPFPGGVLQAVDALLFGEQCFLRTSQSRGACSCTCRPALGTQRVPSVPGSASSATISASLPARLRVSAAL